MTCSVSHLLLAATRRLEAVGIDRDEARVEARVLLETALGVSRAELRLRPERVVTTDEAARFDALVARREAREPLAYVTGEREFYGLPLFVSPAVLVPRPETEFLVEAVLRHVAGREKARVADVGTGSGAIAVAVAVNAPGARVWASDVSPDALVVAARNVARHGIAGRVTLLEGDALAPLASFAPFDVIASNPPYVAPNDIADLAPEVRDWEPRLALGTHVDPLHFYRVFAAEAPSLLVPGALLAVEVGQGQAQEVAELWRAAGLREVAVVKDYADIGRVIMGIRPND